MPNKPTIPKTQHKAKQLKSAAFSKKTIIAFALVFALIGGYVIFRSFAASASNIYVAQNQLGSGSGTDCADAKAATFFNSSANWGTGSTQIGPGTTVHLCGMITNALSPQGSGSSVSPITIQWESGASLSVCDTNLGAFQFNGNSYLTLNLGGNTSAIICPNNGTSLATQLDAIAIHGTMQHDRITNGTIGPMFQRDANDTGASDGMGSELILTNSGSADNQFDHLTFTGAAYGLEYQMGSGVSSDGDLIEYNSFQSTVGTDIRYATGDNSTMTASNARIDHNDIDFGNRWACPGCNLHYDGIMLFQHAGGGHDQIVNAAIYDNKLHGTMNSSSTAAMFFTTGVGTDCSGNSTLSAYVFNNIFTLNGGTGFGDAFVEELDCQHTIAFYNNTMDSLDNSIFNHCFNLDAGSGAGQVITTKNDICMNTMGAMISASGIASYTSDYNDFYNIALHGSNGWRWMSNWYDTLAAWQPVLGQDAHSFTTSPGLNSDYTVAGTTSAVYHAGTNLTSLCTGNLTMLCQDYNGNSRPTSGPWDIGAYQYGSGGAANVYVSTSGNDSTCVRGDNTKPCATLTKALTLASSGDTITISAGTYAPTGTCDSSDGFTHCWYDNSSFSSTVTVNTTGTVNLVGSVVFGHSASNLTINGPIVGQEWSSTHSDDGLGFGGLVYLKNADHIVLNNVSSYDYLIRGASNITIQNGSIGGTSCYEPEIQNDSDGTRPANININHMSFSGFSTDSSLCPSKHLSCTILEGSNVINWSNNTCSSPDEGLLAKSLSGPVASGVTLNSNNFTASSGGGAIYQSTSGGSAPAAWSNWTISNNTASGQQIAIESANATFSGESITGNTSGTLLDPTTSSCPAALGLTLSANINSNNCGGGGSGGGGGTLTIGETTILPNGDNGNANYLLAQSTTLSQTATIQSMSFYVTNAAGKLRLGIYDSSGPSGGPGTLKAQTAEITPTTGWNTANVTSQVSLSPGTYWLAYLPSDNGLAFVNDQTGSAAYYSYAYGSLPSTFSTSPSTGTAHWSLYATLNTGTSSSVPGDTNNDGHVTITDLSTVLSHFGQSGQTLSTGDTNGDGVVTITDLSAVLSHFGQ